MTLIDALRDHQVQRGLRGFRPVGRNYIFVVDPVHEVVKVEHNGRSVPAPMALEILLSEFELVSLPVRKVY